MLHTREVGIVVLCVGESAKVALARLERPARGDGS
jgi:hypothetical protein